LKLKLETILTIIAAACTLLTFYIKAQINAKFYEVDIKLVTMQQEVEYIKKNHQEWVKIVSMGK